MIVSQSKRKEFEGFYNASSSYRYLFHTVKNGTLRSSPKKFKKLLEKGFIYMEDLPKNTVKMTPKILPDLLVMTKVLSHFFGPDNWDFDFQLRRIRKKSVLVLKGFLIQQENVVIKRYSKKESFTMKEYFIRISIFCHIEESKTGVRFYGFQLYTLKSPYDYHKAGDSGDLFVHPHLPSASVQSIISLEKTGLCLGIGDFSVAIETAQLETLNADRFYFLLLNIYDYMTSQSTGNPYFSLSNLKRRDTEVLEDVPQLHDQAFNIKAKAKRAFTVLKLYYTQDLDLNFCFSGNKLDIILDEKADVFLFTFMDFLGYYESIRMESIMSFHVPGVGEVSLEAYKDYKQLIRETQESLRVTLPYVNTTTSGFLVYKGELRFPSFYLHDGYIAKGQLIDPYPMISEEDFTLSTLFKQEFFSALASIINEKIVLNINQKIYDEFIYVT